MNMKRSRTLGVFAAIAASAILLSGCSAGGTSDEASSNTLKLWHFESEDSAMGKAWNEAIKVFEEETGAKVEFEAKAFEQIRTTASQVLNSNEAPDILEYNKGNATAGLLASQGLLANLDDAVAEYGWDEKLADSLATTAKYDERGIMGSGNWFGVPNYGEYVEMYYNKDMFAKYGLEVPTTQAELETVMQAFVDKGVTPLAQAGAEYPLGQLFYQLALTKADRSWIDDYQLYTNPVDWNDAALTYAADTLKSYTDKGFISKNSTGLKAEDMGTAFISGEYPMMFSGSWWYGRVTEEAGDMNWGTFLFPGATYSPGSSGNIWVVPENAKNKDLAYKFIDITMRPEIQAILGNSGGVPVAANPDDITDDHSRELITNFNTLLDQDGLAFYPDWPTATFYDQLVAGTQELVNGTMTPQQMRDQLGADYAEGVAAITGE